eukprot:CAMPEP_0171176652 /NCGR_PEP_ID=MMETSP0790-20130122/11844_1 /TAXON_ID=2925 /ORGANISM="Alexandrium catenella, Strain OF101" /LENGTH=437 /DNA_ID=CAMNT_0011641545 /DNA_START=62 /DNA_END=1375 /DNA_ORIENTATION=+
MAPLFAMALACLMASARALRTVEVMASSSRSNRSCAGPVMTFDDFVVSFNKGYAPGSPQYHERKRLFEERARHIEDHNCNEMLWEAGINKLADWTEAELQSLRGYRGRRTQNPNALSSSDYYSSLDSRPMRRDYPESMDWSNLRAISEPRDQGQCGSCWAFSSEVVLRSHAEIKGWPSNFSVTQIISCTPNEHQCGGTGGCDGATVELAFDYVLRQGLVSEHALPYPNGGGSVHCPASMMTTPAKVDGILDVDGSEVHMLRTLEDPKAAKGHSIGMVGWTKFPENRADQMMRALVEEGPVAIAVAASQGWNYYRRGLMPPSACDLGFVISHAVVLYGFGKVNGHKFWRIKNSWGQDWGERGNLRLVRLDDEEALCGWDKHPEVGSGCKGGPSKVWACGSCGILYDTAVPHFVPYGSQDAEEGLAVRRPSVGVVKRRV